MSLPPLMAMSPEVAPELSVDGWQCFQSTIPAKTSNVKDITVKVHHQFCESRCAIVFMLAQLYIPASRIFCMSEPIPFYLTFKSTALSLAAFLPFGPVTTPYASSKRHTRIQLLRQSTVDVRCVFPTLVDIAMYLNLALLETHWSSVQRPTYGK